MPSDTRTQTPARTIGLGTSWVVTRTHHMHMQRAYVAHDTHSGLAAPHGGTTHTVLRLASAVAPRTLSERV